jgi:hypothetical protein
MFLQKRGSVTPARRQSAKKKGRSDLNETDGLFRLSQKSSFSGSTLPFVSLICVARFSGEPSLSYRVLPSIGSDCFLTAALVQDLTPNHSLSLPKGESKDDANRTQTTRQSSFSVVCMDTQTVSQPRVTLQP